MLRKTNQKFKSIVSLILTVCMMATFIPAAFAAQSNEYVDPADNWLSSNNRTNELDVNATTTYETSYCAVCDKDTTVLTYRVPEYTKSGETALNRGVKFSDGTCLDGEDKGNLDDGLPGVDAFFTGYHWTKSVCQTCGTINAVDGPGEYNFNNNVYALNSCDHNFFLDFDATTYEPYDEESHLTTLKRGQYCKFCKGTFARASRGLEDHNFTETVDGQLGNNRFFISEKCDDCGYTTSEYVTAKSVVASYYGIEDGDAHTLTVSDLSDRGVKTSILYGTSADSCNKTSAPNYTKAGYYTVYYKINYSYAGETITENGVSYVWLVANDSNDNSNGGDTIIVIPPAHEHDYHYLETVKPNCENLGYDRFQCNGCGDLIKTNYTQSTGHKYKAVTFREATCKQGGLKLWMCAECGDFYEETTPIASHSYKTEKHNPTCRMTGYTNHICEVCGDNYITDITPIISHSYENITKEPTCTDKGYTTHTCTMCGYNYVSDYTEATGHDWDEGHSVTSSTCESEGVIEFNCRNCDEKMIKAESATGHTPGTAATCTEPQICEKCGTVLELPKGHSYDSETVEPTCTSMGYTVYTCHCGDSYTGAFTDKAEHDYNKVVTAPTCTSHGYTTYSCKNCDDAYVSDFVEKAAHSYTSVATPPTCTSMGYTTYTCEDCGDTYKADYTDMTEHNYNKVVTEPTCTEHGYAVYTCPDCGKSYIGDYTDCKEHHYTETVIAPTCTEMGYSIFKCEDCEDEYKGNYIAALGHTPSDWIIDIPATIEQAGEKHIECTVCSNVLQRAAIPQLIDTDHSDEDGNAQVGAFSIILTNKDGKSVFDSEITIDVNDNVTIKLPEGKLLDYADQTTITAFYTDTQEPKADLQIFIYDGNNNAATGKTDENGQLAVPNNQSSTGDDNGTIGTEDGGEKMTYVVTVTDKANVVIPNCDIYIGESNNLVVDLADGVKPARENPVIITVSDQNGNAQTGVTVIALGDADYVEKGVTDIYGKVTLPFTNEGYTDEDGKVNVNGINVIVNDEQGFIPNAYVIHNEDGSIAVTLPEEKSISHANRITVTVLDSVGNPIAEKAVTVTDIAEAAYTATTDENGKIVVSPLSEDMTDSEGKAVVNGYHVLITDETKPIENAFITIIDGKINVKLPDSALIDIENRITATVTDSENKPVKDMSVTFTDSAEKTETNLTDENGRATVPPTNIDYTDVNGYSEVDGYIVTVVNETGAIESAFVKHTVTPNEPDENGEVKKTESISVVLPENVTFDYANRITVTVLNKSDKTPVKDMAVTVTEAKTAESEETPKSANGVTDKNGTVTFPPLSEDITDDKGDSGVRDEKPTENPDNPGETETIEYKVIVEDTKGMIPGAFVEIKDGKISVTLPDTHTLTTSNQTTVTVLDKENKGVQGISVTVKDKSTEKTATTNASGKIIVPVKSSGGGSSSGGSSSGGGGGWSSSYSAINVMVTDKDGKTVSVSKSTGTEKVTLTLPTGKTLKNGNWYTVTVTKNGKAQAGYTVILKDRENNEATGKTDANGVILLPTSEHKAYIVGYDDGTFRPDSDMTRAEAATIFARLIAERKGESISGKAAFGDVSSKEWYYSYIGYLAKYDIIQGYEDKTFRPDAPVTRAEFVTMTVRFYGLFDEVKYSADTTKYSDLSSGYWAIKDISFAKHIGWLNGYADGTFRGDNNITRAEVVTVVNRATGRRADESYINKNLSVLNKFTDLKNNSHWGWADIMEAANDHKAVSISNGETWVK